MLLPFTANLVTTTKFDPETALLADRHYSRQKPGTSQFMPPGRTIIIRDQSGLIVFGWLSQEFRADKEAGYCCTIFRNESERQSSGLILECELIAFERWGADRVFTYVDPAQIASVNPGYCFKRAGWKFVRRLPDGKHLLAKNPE